MVLKASHIEAHISKSWTAEEHQNNQQVSQDFSCSNKSGLQYKGELCVGWWGYDTSGYRGRDAT